LKKLKYFVLLLFSSSAFSFNINVEENKFKNTTFLNLTENVIELEFPNDANKTFVLNKYSSWIIPCSSNPISEVIINYKGNTRAKNISFTCSKKYLIKEGNEK
jgi:hypothetical protein